MIELTNILCPIDFSEFSRRALNHAAALARWYEARLTVLGVHQNLLGLDLPPVPLGERERERILLELKRFTAHLPADARIELRLEEAPEIHRSILNTARTLGADLLVIGSHGRSGFERLLLGSVTEKIMRQAPCPTLIVPRNAAEGTGPDAPVQYRRIVCPVDFSAGSTRALSYAMSLAEEADARLTVLHVMEVPPEILETPPSPEFNLDAIHAAAEADRLRRLRELIPEEARTYCTIQTAVHEGAAYREVLKVAAEQQADLIVMGVQGRGAIDLLVFGSNTARVARAAACPVLIVRGEPA